MGDEATGAEAFAQFLGEQYERKLLKDAVVAQSRQDRNRIWAYRESPYEYSRHFPQELRFDVSVPLAKMSQAIESLRQGMRQWPDAISVFFGHVADSNIHVSVMMPNLSATGSAIQSFVYDVVAELGGSVSAEHGIGRIKRSYLGLSRTEPELALMFMLKGTLDPKGILNPGRVL
jgi:FAD/FMN-containing dehydrogenase